MPNELDGEEGMFAYYYDKRYDVSNRETALPYVDSFFEPEIDDKKIKKVVRKYIDNLKKVNRRKSK